LLVVHKKRGGNDLAVIGAFVDFADTSDAFTAAFISVTNYFNIVRA
jgi:hypothetical protein